MIKRQRISWCSVSSRSSGTVTFNACKNEGTLVKLALQWIPHKKKRGRLNEGRGQRIAKAVSETNLRAGQWEAD